jgi:hypothetical protein
MQSSQWIGLIQNFMSAMCRSSCDYTSALDVMYLMAPHNRLWLHVLCGLGLGFWHVKSRYRVKVVPKEATTAV